MSSPTISMKPAAGATAAIAAYAFSQGGTAALGSNLMYPVAFAAGGSIAYDMIPQISTAISGFTNGDNKMARSVFLFALEVGGLMVMYPILSMQERMVFGAAAAVGSYVFN